MKSIKLIQLFFLLILFLIFFNCNSIKIIKRETLQKHNARMLLITSDFGDIMQCSTYKQLVKIADIMISAHPDIISFDVAIPNLCYYKTSIGYYWSGKNMDKLYEKGYDPFEIIVNKLRKAGIKVLAGIRMNDHHGALDMWTPWDRAHIEWSLGRDTGDRSWRAVGDLRQMDYAIKGVREYRLSIIEEIINKYNVDGIQLDFGRTAPFLSESKQEKAKYLTQYIRDIRETLDNVGKNKNRVMTLGMILPWDLSFCEKEGIEIKKWIQENLVSYVSPGEWFYADWNIPLEGWVEITKGTNCKLYPMTCGNVSPYQLPWEMGLQTLLSDNRVLDPAKIRAMAETFYNQGAEGFMFYNFYVSGSEQDQSFAKYYPFLRDWTNPAKLNFLTRHYFFCRHLRYIPTEHYSFGMPKGYASGEKQPFFRFPLQKEGDVACYLFRFYSDLTSSSTKFRFKLKDIYEGDRIEVKINNSPVEPETLTINTMPVYRVEIWEKTISVPPLKKGPNEIHIKLLKCDQYRKETIEVGEFEVIIEPF